MTVGLIIAGGIFSFLLLMLAQTIEKEHKLLKIVIYGFAVICLVLVAKGSVEDANPCDLIVTNQTVSGNVTTFEYGTHCYAATNNSNSTTLYRLSLGFLSIFMLYIMVFYLIVAVRKVIEVFRKS